MHEEDTHFPRTLRQRHTRPPHGRAAENEQVTSLDISPDYRAHASTPRKAWTIESTSMYPLDQAEPQAAPLPVLRLDG
jgi:hypothetical protein